MSCAGLEVDASLEERAGPGRIQGQTPGSGLAASRTTPSTAQICVSSPASLGSAARRIRTGTVRGTENHSIASECPGELDTTAALSSKLSQR